MNEETYSVVRCGPKVVICDSSLLDDAKRDVLNRVTKAFTTNKEAILQESEAQWLRRLLGRSDVLVL